MTGISKVFGATQALDGVDFEVYEGEVIGLIGPNGAGKSTLVKVITGDVYPSAGTIRVGEEDISFEKYERKYVSSKGMICVYQELSLCKNLSIYENFMITHNKEDAFAGLRWRKKAKKFASAAMDDVFPDHGIDMARSLEDYAFGQQQMVELARAISYSGLKLLILDEPTSSLTHDRIDQLHDFIRILKQKGVATIYVSHKLEEIKRICDRIVIMQNGQVTGEVSGEEVVSSDLVTMLGGRRANRAVVGVQKREGDIPIVSITGLTTDVLKNISLEIKKGEIVGLSGLGESGQKELLDEIYFANGKRRKKHIEVSSEVGFVSGDRRGKGIFHFWSIKDNINIASLKKLSRGGILNRIKASELAQIWFDKLKFKANSFDDEITSLSGGNQQKALIARGIASDADIILLDDPTRGVDVETKQEIYRLLQEAKASGKAVVWHSTEDEEMLQCDRVYIMRLGEIVHTFEEPVETVGEIVDASFKNEKTAAQATIKESKQKKNGTLSKIRSSRWLLPVITFLVILGLNAYFNSNSVSYMGFEYLIGGALPLMFVALAQMMVVQLGDIDLGIGAGMGLINVITAMVFVNNFGLGLLLYVVFIICYAGMGALIHIRKLPPLIVTLGASFVWQGIALLIQPTPGGTAPQWLLDFYEFHFPLAPVPVVLCIVVALIMYWFSKKSKYGAVLRGTGNNAESIVHAGWSYLLARVAVYAFAGFLIVLAGLSMTAICYGSDASTAGSYTMTSIATVILGGCTFAGGISEPIGVICGGFAISLISSLLVFLGASTNLQPAVIGLILILALVARMFTKRRSI